jgi:DNA-binding transcriptional ArsR family regulator
VDLRILNPSTFRLLASRTRVEMLRMLASRPHTPTELAKALGVTEQTAQYHLRKLAHAGFVERREDERIWAYHQLTLQGRELVTRPPTTTPLAALAIIVAFASAVCAWIWQRAQPEPLPPTSMASPAPVPEWVAWVGYAGLGLLAAAVILGLAWFAARRSTRRQK